MPELHVRDYCLGHNLEGVLTGFFDAERLSKAEISQDIKDQAVSPFGQVYRLRPAMAVNRQLIPSIQVLDDESCRRAYRAFCKHSVEEFSLPRMNGYVGDVASPL